MGGFEGLMKKAIKVALLLLIILLSILLLIKIYTIPIRKEPLQYMWGIADDGDYDYYIDDYKTAAVIGKAVLKEVFGNEINWGITSVYLDEKEDTWIIKVKTISILPMRGRGLYVAINRKNGEIIATWGDKN